ncbi:MAG: hypothetical protein R2695_08660 [Acidimicrobiales bacterium]
MFTFVHCTETLDEAIASRAAEAAMGTSRGTQGVRRASQDLDEPHPRQRQQRRPGTRPRRSRRRGRQIMVDMDPDDPNPIIRLITARCWAIRSTPWRPTGAGRPGLP